MYSKILNAQNPRQKLFAWADGVHYNRQTHLCDLHDMQDFDISMEPHALVAKELAEMPRHKIEDAIRGRTVPFDFVIREFRKEEKKPKLELNSMALHIYDNIIRLEVAAAACDCRHTFYLIKENFYDVICDAEVESLDIHVDKRAQDFFEFVAITLPGNWCRSLKALNISFEDKSCLDSLAMFLKKTKNLSVLRVANKAEIQIAASELVRNMQYLEELELNCPDNTDNGYTLDGAFLKWLVDSQKRTGALKPFRMLKAFNTQLEVSAAEFMKQCRSLARLPHNQKYSDYLSLNEVRGRDQVDFEDPEHCINFEISPTFPLEVCKQMFDSMADQSKSCLQYFDDPTRRYFLMEGALFRLVDGTV